MIKLEFRTRADLESFIRKIAAGIAKEEADKAIAKRLHFRSKLDVATPTSALQAQQKATGALPVSGGTLTGPLVTATIGFYGTPASAQKTVTGSKAGNAALASLLSQLSALGLLVDSST